MYATVNQKRFVGADLFQLRYSRRWNQHHRVRISLKKTGYYFFNAGVVAYVWQVVGSASGLQGSSSVAASDVVDKLSIVSQAYDAKTTRVGQSNFEP